MLRILGARIFPLIAFASIGANVFLYNEIINSSAEAELAKSARDIVEQRNDRLAERISELASERDRISRLYAEHSQTNREIQESAAHTLTELRSLREANEQVNDYLSQRIPADVSASLREQ